MESQVISDGSHDCGRSLGWKFTKVCMLLDLKTGSVEECSDLEYCYLSGMVLIVRKAGS